MKRKPTPRLDALLSEAREFCENHRGQAAALARALDVAPAQISAWLARRNDPSGETALQISAWLADARADEATARPSAPPDRLTHVLKPAPPMDFNAEMAAKFPHLRPGR